MVRRNIAWGIAWGARVAIVFSAVATVSTVLRIIATQMSLEAGFRLLALALAIYVFGAITGGAVVGMLRPWAKSWLRSVIVGFIAGTPITLFGLLSVVGLDKFGVPLVVASVVVAAIWSIIAVSMIWDGSISKLD